MRKDQDQHQREVLEFDHGVAAYPPGESGGYWRIRWEESRRRRDTTAKSRSAAIAKATDIVERLARSTPTELGRARGADLVAHYLDPQRRPPRVNQWSEKHRDDQTRYCELYVNPVIGGVPCRDLSRTDFQTIIDQARTASVAQHLRRCLTGLVGAGLEEGYLLVRQDVLRGVRWQGELVAPAESADQGVTQEEILSRHRTPESLIALPAPARPALAAVRATAWRPERPSGCRRMDSARRRLNPTGCGCVGRWATTTSSS